MDKIKRMMFAVYREEHALYVAENPIEAGKFIRREHNENPKYKHIPLRIVEEEWTW